MKAKVERAVRALYRVEAMTAAVAYAFTAGILILDIVMREVFSSSVWGATKMAVFGAIIAAFIGLILATATNTHLRPAFADYWVPRSWDRAMNRIADTISALLWCGFGVVGIQYLGTSIDSNDLAEVLYIPLWPIQLVLPYAFFSSALRHAVFAVWPDLKPSRAVEEG